MRKLSLFSGIGGIDLAAHWAGMETVAFCEREPFPQKVLQKNFPGVPIYDDVCTLTADRLKEDGIIGDGRTIDIISAGYPCQPFSNAGKRRGKEDDRHLWPEVARILQEVRPTWFLGENVAGHITLGLDEVLADLEGLGYTAQAFVVPASAIYAGHRRDRVFIVGHTERSRCSGKPRRWADQVVKDGHLQCATRTMGDASSSGLQERRRSERTESATEAGTRVVTEFKRSSKTLAYSQSNTEGRLSIRERTQNTRSACSSENVAHTTCERCGETRRNQCGGPKERTSGSGTDVADSSSSGQQKFDPARITKRTGFGTGCIDEGGTYRAAQSRMGGNTHELPSGMDGRGIDSLDDLIDLIHSYPQPALMGIQQYDWEPPRVETGVKNRTGRLKALGNAVNPLQIYPIMAAIKAINDRL